MFAVFIVALFKLGILLSTVFSCIRLRKKRLDAHSFIMKSIDNNTNENIYERKMGPIHDEPIMAKYIQPNNFYSPRVRNPRIFPNKPNEMVWELAAEINALEGKLEKFSEYLYKHQADSIMWWRVSWPRFKNSNRYLMEVLLCHTFLNLLMYSAISCRVKIIICFVL